MSDIEPLMQYIRPSMSYVLERIEGWLLIPTDSVPPFLLFVFAGLAFGVLTIAWQAKSRVRPFLIIGAFATVPIAVFATILSLEAMRGAPDDQCARYDGGKMNFRLQSITVVNQDTYNPFAGNWYLLVARSDRWGNTPHICRVDANSKAGKFLKKTFFRKSKEGEYQEEFVHFSRESFVLFSFGRPFEEPNVTFKPKVAPGKKPYPSQVDEEREKLQTTPPAPHPH